MTSSRKFPIQRDDLCVIGRLAAERLDEASPERLALRDDLLTTSLVRVDRIRLIACGVVLGIAPCTTSGPVSDHAPGADLIRAASCRLSA